MGYYDEKLSSAMINYVYRFSVMAISATAYEEDIRKSKETGMNAPLTKPVEAHIVYEALDKYIKQF